MTDAQDQQSLDTTTVSATTVALTTTENVVDATTNDVPPPTFRRQTPPSWADRIRRVPPTTFEAWLGEDPGRQPLPAVLEEDPKKLLATLGSLQVDNIDIAPEIGKLLQALTEHK
jgi:hypothetical protein